MDITRIIYWLFVILISGFSHFNYGECVIPLIPIAVGGIASGLASYMSICYFKECCTDEYIPANFPKLEASLKTGVYGQHLAYDTVVNALKGHFGTTEPKKALVMSFHGLPGIGKNYVANFITDALYKRGAESDYVHFYKGRLNFPSDGKVEEYKEWIQKEISNHLRRCKRSLFIFDEVDKIPEGVLNALVPFLDYHPMIAHVNPTEAIFIFLSNTGGTLIAQRLINLWKDGKKREETKLQDFENLLARGAFNEKGGFHKCETIEVSLIDYYIPFLPLEEVHVRACIIDAFQRRGVEPSDTMIAEGLSHVTFGPDTPNIYSTAGCKRLDHKISLIIQRDHILKQLQNPN